MVAILYAIVVIEYAPVGLPMCVKDFLPVGGYHVDIQIGVGLPGKRCVQFARPQAHVGIASSPRRALLIARAALAMLSTGIGAGYGTAGKLPNLAIGVKDATGQKSRAGQNYEAHRRSHPSYMVRKCALV
jgi:hypothetical protein